MMKFLVIISITVFTLTGCGTSLPFGLPAPSTGPTLTNLSQEEVSMLSLINGLRAQYGVGPLQTSPPLQQSAGSHSEYMNSTDTLTHSEATPNFSSDDRINNAGGNFSTTGENIACGNSSASATFNQWKNSPGHLANMISSNYQFIGIARGGTSADENHKGCPWYWTTDFGGN